MFRTLFRPGMIRRLVPAVWAAMDERHLGLIAAGVAFYAMLAVFPGLAVLISVWGWFSDPSVIRDYVAIAQEFVPADAIHLIEDELVRILSSNRALSWATLVSVAVGFWSAWSAVMALIDALNAVHAHEHRSGLARYLFPLVMTFALTGLFLSALAAMVGVPALLAVLTLGPYEAWLLKALPTTVLILGLLIFLGMFYRWAPNVEYRPSWITPGALLAAVLWSIVSIAFSIYLSYFGTYARVYGSIGAVVALLVWFYLSAYIVLLGGVVNAEISRIRNYRGQ